MNITNEPGTFTEPIQETVNDRLTRFKEKKGVGRGGGKQSDMDGLLCLQTKPQTN